MNKSSFSTSFKNMEHELLHNESDYNLRLGNKGKKEKEKVDPGDRKKWNFRKPNTGSTVETGSNRSPSPTSGLINPSAEVRSKRVVSPTMIFENKIDENDSIEQTELGSPPTTTNLPVSSVQQQVQTSPKTVNFDNQTTTPNSKRMRQKSLPLSASPPLSINRPQSLRKSSERFHRQTSSPVIVTPIPQASKPAYQQSHIAVTSEPFSQTPIQSDRSDVHRSVNIVGDLPANNQWKTIQQPLFTASDQLSNTVQDDINVHRQRPASEKDIPVGETMDETRKMMWQGNNQQEMIHGVNWTDFSSTTNEVFVPDEGAWAGTKNIALEAEEVNEDQSEGDATNSSRSSNSSDSGNEEETEESVWKINDEQRAYYLNQFRILQPAEKGVVAGQTARNFFLKSGLAKDVLSKIWNLADLDNDGALNFEEFCIAMHIVVAVRHGLEVPAALPHYLTPEQYEKQVPVASPPQTLEPSNQEQLPLPEPSQAWARFSPDPQNASQMVPPDDEGTVTGQQVIQPVVQQAQPVVQQTQPDVQPTQPVTSPKRRCERTMSDPTSSDEKSTKENTNQPVRKTSLGIPRVRGQSKQTNLLDTPHWAILPPPSKFTKEIPEEVNKSGLFVPTGTIIPADTERAALPKIEKADRPLPRDSQSDSSSSETEEPDNQKERPSSLTKENVDLGSSPGSLSRNSSQSSVGDNQDAVDGGTKPTAPVPPPRKRTGHSRSSSLDLQKLFNNKGGSASLQDSNKVANNTGIKTQNDAVDDPGNKDSPQASKNNQENFADFSKFENTLTIAQPTENMNRHRRSASLDSTHAIWVEPSQPTQTQAVEAKHPSTTRHEVTASLPRPVPKNKPASPPPPMRQKKDAQQDSGSDGMIEKEKKSSKEPIHFVVKPLTRLEQLHARIRDLKTKNTRLSRVNNELQQELKQMMEKRIGLESSLEQLKPFAK